MNYLVPIAGSYIFQLQETYVEIIFCKFLPSVKRFCWALSCFGYIIIIVDYYHWICIPLTFRNTSLILNNRGIVPIMKHISKYTGAWLIVTKCGALPIFSVKCCKICQITVMSTDRQFLLLIFCSGYRQKTIHQNSDTHNDPQPNTIRYLHFNIKTIFPCIDLIL